MRSFWQKHSADGGSIEEMMLNSNASAIESEERAEIMKMLPPLADKKVLELAAGSGRFTGSLATAAKQVTAVDFIQKFIDTNRSKHEHLSNVKFMCQDVMSLDVAPKSVDLIFVNWLLMYLSDDEVRSLADRMLHWLAPGGTVFSRESCYGPSGNACDGEYNPTYYRTPEAYRELFLQARAMSGGDKRYAFELAHERRVETYALRNGVTGQMTWTWLKALSTSADGKVIMKQKQKHGTPQESTFCPYDETSKAYDQTRVPLGVGAMLGSLAMSEWPLREQRLLDIGGGTGTFLQMVHGKFKDATLFEVNNGMMKQAKARLGDRVKYQQGSANTLEEYFAHNTFHAVTMNQVIHHFPVEDDYAFLYAVFAQIYRVTAEGGAFVLNHASHEQHRSGYWWFRFMPKACDKYCASSPPLPIVLKYLREVGFAVDENEIYVPPYGLLMPDTYMKYGLEGAFMKSYRDGDSGWNAGEQTGELESCFKQIRELQAAGKEQELIEELETERRKVGQTTFITARKL